MIFYWNIIVPSILISQNGKHRVPKKSVCSLYPSLRWKTGWLPSQKRVKPGCKGVSYSGSKTVRSGQYVWNKHEGKCCSNNSMIFICALTDQASPTIFIPLQHSGGRKMHEIFSQSRVDRTLKNHAYNDALVMKASHIVRHTNGDFFLSNR
jgi:hypothetical protein